MKVLEHRLQVILGRCPGAYAYCARPPQPHLHSWEQATWYRPTRATFPQPQAHGLFSRTDSSGLCPVL